MPRTMASVTVIVPTYNRANYLGECLASLLAQTVAPLEILVIDDGSSDNTGELLRGYGAPVRYFRKDNGGKPSAVNLGLKHASGDFIWVFDDDDVALPRAIESRLDVFGADPSIDFVYSPHYRGRDGAQGHIAIGNLYQPALYEGDQFFRELMKGCFFHLGATLIRRSAFDRIGGFDTDLLSSEDYDLQLRLAQHLRGAYCKEPSFVFRQHEGIRGSSVIRYAAKDRVKVFRRFDQAIGRRLRRDVPLTRYAEHRIEPHAAGGTATAEALLARAVVMASKACLSEMLEDIHTACRCMGMPALPLPTWARENIAQAICTEYASAAVAADWDNFRNEMHRLIPDAGTRRPAAHAMALGVFRLLRGYPSPMSQKHTWLKLALQLRLFR